MASPSYLSGIVWSGANACVAVLMPIGIFVFFARTASPEMIGAVALAASCIEILKTVAMPGLYEAVLQQPDDQQRCHETASFVLLLSACALLFVYFVGLATLSIFIASVTSHWVAFAVLGSRVLFDLAALQPQARLAQRLAFRRLAARTMVSISLGGAIGVALALLVDPFTGLIAYQVSQSMVFLMVTVIGTGAAARPRLHRSCFLRMRREDTLATCVRLLAASANNLDQIIVAALIGSVPLAFYNLGKRLELTFVTVAGSFSAILFQPRFAQGRTERHGRDLRQGVAILTIVLGLPAAAFIVNSSFLVATAFGEQWKGASALAAVMAAGGFIRAIGYVPGALMSVSIRNRELFLISLISVVTGAVLVVVAAPFGILWCAVALLIRHLAGLGWMAAILRHEMMRPVHAYFTGLVTPFVLMLAATLVAREVIGDAATGDNVLQQFLMLAGSVAAGAAAGAGYFAWYFREMLFRYVAMLRCRLAAPA
jgi:O-antigen/teichoic acid export membrane protein